MPKSFKVMVEIEEIALGSVFNKLDGMQGVIAVNIIGSGPKPTGPTPPNTAAAGTTLLCVMLKRLRATKGNAVHRKQLEASIVAAGKSASSLNSALSSAKNEGYVRFKGDGVYSLLDKGRKYLDANCVEG